LQSELDADGRDKPWDKPGHDSAQSGSMQSGARYGGSRSMAISARASTPVTRGSIAFDIKTLAKAMDARVNPAHDQIGSY
jgi:hypothetical protein